MQTYTKLNPLCKRPLCFAIVGVALATSVACGGDDDIVDDMSDGGHSDGMSDGGHSDGMSDGGHSDGMSEGEEDPRELYIVHSAVENADGTRANYFTLTPSLTEETELDYKDSIEVPGRARLYAQPDLGFFAIGDGEDLSITRYTIDENNEVEAGDSFSLQPYGVASLGARAVHFVSPTKAYYKDTSQGQIILWNPKKMEVEDTIELPDDAVKEGHRVTLSEWGARDGEAYFTVSWPSENYDRLLPGTMLAHIDTETDEMTVTEDDRCRGLGKVASYEGALYFFSNVINGFGHAVYPDDGGQQDCALRIEEGETTFDPDYVGSVAEVLEDDQIGTVIDLTSDGTAWVQVVDLNVAPTEPGSTYSEWYAEGWTWYQIPFDTLEDAREVPGEPGAYSGSASASGSSYLIAQAEADYSKTTLMDVSAKKPKAGISFPGFVLGTARVR